ncbi:MAG: hypothetical protein JRI23_11765 [Deltaproteobacteria bacterium]|jgi:hypothetical protein|nr:hypothetical protein [Deltaproteobacteria bacterium]MBW2532379.1 hypothetical protein [Deltaproteobacteria bacterium]
MACEDDEACVGDEICLLATATVDGFASFWGEDDGGGPARGYCSLPCVDDADCHGPDNQCLGRAPDGICVLGCTFGEPAISALDDPIPTTKCRGRDDLMCAPVSGGGAVCLPVCGSDDECPTDRFCDQRVGLCVSEPRQGAPLGSSCEPDDPGTSADEDSCAGWCQVFADGNEEVLGKLCTSHCSLGGALDGTDNCGGPQQGLCLFQLGFEEQQSGIGDQGLCSNACQTHGECNVGDGLACFDQGTLDQLGVGYCIVTTPCPAGNECAGDEVCVASSAGPICVEEDPAEVGEPKIPLGTAAPGGAGGGGGAGGAGAAASGGGGAASSGGSGGAASSGGSGGG